MIERARPRCVYTPGRGTVVVWLDPQLCLKVSLSELIFHSNYTLIIEPDLLISDI